MTEETKEMAVHEQEMVETDGAEPMRSRATFIPRSDIYETEENFVVTVDMPGTNQESIDITLEKNVLTINGVSNHGAAPTGYSLGYAEFQPGDYERSFRLTNLIDHDNINAAFKDGVLTLTLPKAAVAKTRKITVNS